MTDQEKPLHVRVAEALGCEPRLTGDWWHCTCAPDPIHDDEGIDGAPHEGGILLAYDIDWAATGPLIERYGITVGRHDLHGLWYAHRPPWERIAAKPTPTSYLVASVDNVGQSLSRSPLGAVCHQILVLDAVGKLLEVPNGA
jgi:hypothetical protein